MTNVSPSWFHFRSSLSIFLSSTAQDAGRLALVQGTTPQSWAETGGPWESRGTSPYSISCILPRSCLAWLEFCCGSPHPAPSLWSSSSSDFLLVLAFKCMHRDSLAVIPQIHSFLNFHIVLCLQGHLLHMHSLPPSTSPIPSTLILLLLVRGMSNSSHHPWSLTPSLASDASL